MHPAYYYELLQLRSVILFFFYPLEIPHGCVERLISGSVPLSIRKANCTLLILLVLHTVLEEHFLKTFKTYFVITFLKCYKLKDCYNIMS